MILLVNFLNSMIIRILHRKELYGKELYIIVYSCIE